MHRRSVCREFIRVRVGRSCRTSNPKKGYSMARRETSRPRRRYEGTAEQDERREQRSELVVVAVQGLARISRNYDTLFVFAAHATAKQATKGESILFLCRV